MSLNKEIQPNQTKPNQTKYQTFLVLTSFIYGFYKKNSSELRMMLQSQTKNQKPKQRKTKATFKN